MHVLTRNNVFWRILRKNPFKGGILLGLYARLSTQGATVAVQHSKQGDADRLTV